MRDQRSIWIIIVLDLVFINFRTLKINRGIFIPNLVKDKEYIPSIPFAHCSQYPLYVLFLLTLSIFSFQHMHGGYGGY
jgi:hypothetical protein